MINPCEYDCSFDASWKHLWGSNPTDTFRIQKSFSMPEEAEKEPSVIQKALAFSWLLYPNGLFRVGVVREHVSPEDSPTSASQGVHRDGFPFLVGVNIEPMWIKENEQMVRLRPGEFVSVGAQQLHRAPVRGEITETGLRTRVKVFVDN